MNTASVSAPEYLMLNFPERDYREYRSFVEDFNDLGWRMEMTQLFDLGFHAIYHSRYDPSQLVHVANKLYITHSDMFMLNVCPELAMELLLVALETLYADFMEVIQTFKLSRVRLRVVDVTSAGVLVEV